MRSRRGIASWALVCGVLPFAYFASLMPAGTPLAEGCSGAGDDVEQSGVIFMNLPSDWSWPKLDALPVGTDGFFAFWITYAGILPEDLGSVVTVEVRDDANQLVPGSLQRLQSVEHGGEAEVYLGWQADEPLTPGELLSASVLGTGSDGDVSIATGLDVRDSEPALDAEASFQDFRLYRFDDGPRVDCSVSSDCGPNLGFGTEFSTAYAAWFQVVLEPEVVFAWEYSIEPVTGKGTLTKDAITWEELDESTPPSATLTAYRATADLDRGFDLLFRQDLAEYCVTLKLKDLRTGKSHSEEVCSSRPAELETEERDLIRECEEVPEEYRARWCATEPPFLEGDECDAFNGSGGAPSEPTGTGGASAGHSGESAGRPPLDTGGTRADVPSIAGSKADLGEPEPEPEPEPGSDDENGVAPQSRTVVTEGCGCSTPGTSAKGSAWLAFGALASVLFARRRRR